MNHRINAVVNRLPTCPECLAAALKPCVGPGGAEREPHACRQRIVDGELFVFWADDCRRERKIEAVRELTVAVYKPTRSDYDARHEKRPTNDLPVGRVRR